MQTDLKTDCYLSYYDVTKKGNNELKNENIS